MTGRQRNTVTSKSIATPLQYLWPTSFSARPRTPCSMQQDTITGTTRSHPEWFTSSAHTLTPLVQTCNAAIARMHLAQHASSQYQSAAHAYKAVRREVYRKCRLAKSTWIETHARNAQLRNPAQAWRHIKALKKGVCLFQCNSCSTTVSRS
jgi:hypothetical protein